MSRTFQRLPVPYCGPRRRLRFFVLGASVRGGCSGAGLVRISARECIAIVVFRNAFVVASNSAGLTEVAVKERWVAVQRCLSQTSSGREESVACAAVMSVQDGRTHC